MNPRRLTPIPAAVLLALGLAGSASAHANYITASAKCETNGTFNSEPSTSTPASPTTWPTPPGSTPAASTSEPSPPGSTPDTTTVTANPRVPAVVDIGTPPVPPGELPATGRAVAPLVAWAITFLVVGGTLLVARRRTVK